MRSKGLYAAEEVFDEMPPLVFFSVMFGISAGPLAERNDGLHVVGARNVDPQGKQVRDLVRAVHRQRDLKITKHLNLFGNEVLNF